MFCTILCKLLDELAEKTPRAQVKMSGWAVTCCATFCRAGPGAADSADCCMIRLVWPAQTAGAVHTFRQSSHHHQQRPVIGYWHLMLCSDWLRRINAGSTCLDLHSAEPGPVLCFAKQKTCPCQSLNNSFAPTNRMLKYSSMDKFEAQNGVQSVHVYIRDYKNFPCHRYSTSIVKHKQLRQVNQTPFSNSTYLNMQTGCLFL